ncbi:MAG TPA: lipoyl synthase [Polyangiaceae bacterium]|nr:lipoyl synthase [Polyangiaceae bacterium]
MTFDAESGNGSPGGLPPSDGGGDSTPGPGASPNRGKPQWLKVRAPGGKEYSRLKQTLRKLDLHTVCEEARCPNVGECWSAGTATVMILGDTCTRACRFCAVKTGNPRGGVDPREPEHVARALAELELKYAVLTMVDRDDLLDGGADHVASTVQALKRRRPSMLVETLVGDFRGNHAAIETVVEARPDVFAHNLEVTRALTRTIRDARCSYDRSLDVLAHAKRTAPERLTKSSLMVGLGETVDEVLDAMRDLRGAQVDIVTLGQYLRPTPKHAAVERYVSPDEFAMYEREGLKMGFQFVASGPLVRSSYHAAEAFVAAAVAPGARAGAAASSAVGVASEDDALDVDRPGVQSRGVVAGQLLRPESLVRR